MTIARNSAERVRRRKGRINRKVFDATTEADIRRHAKEDGTSIIDLAKALREGRARLVLPVKSVRKKTGLSQAKFARAFQISEHTLRNWEQGRRVPEGPAQALLLAIYRNPKAVMKALQIF